jgi:putative phosphoesterase
MRLAVVADIHGNLDALQAVLAHLAAQSPDLVVNLGDCLSGPLWPAETCDLLMSLPWITLRGNHDRWLVNPPASLGPWEVSALPHLYARHLEWLAGLPPTASFQDIFACHATPQDDLTYWMERPGQDGELHRRPLAEITEHAIGIRESLLLCGHSHIPRVVRLLDGRLVLNPGSVGAPGFTDNDPPHRMAAGTPFASYAIIDRTALGWEPAFHLVAYDTGRAVARAGADRDWAEALATGWVGETAEIM